MADTHTPVQRSANMARIRGSDTEPELRVRRLIHRFGYRYRCHGRDLPGKPDIVFSKRRKAIFVHGCFWHQHEGCPSAVRPKSNQDYWVPKLSRNVARDADALLKLTDQGWEVLTVWECETTLPELEHRLRRFLGPREIQLPSKKSRG